MSQVHETILLERQSRRASTDPGDLAQCLEIGPGWLPLVVDPLRAATAKVRVGEAGIHASSALTASMDRSAVTEGHEPASLDYWAAFLGRALLECSTLRALWNSS